MEWTQRAATVGHEAGHGRSSVASPSGYLKLLLRAILGEAWQLQRRETDGDREMIYRKGERGEDTGKTKKTIGGQHG